MKKWWLGLCSALFVFLPTISFANTVPSADVIRPAAAVQQQQTPVASTATSVHVEPIRSYRSSSRSYGSRSYSSGSSTYAPTRSRFGSGIGSHLFSFGAGMLFAHLFNPFGFGGGYGAGLGLFHLILDIFIIWIIWRIVRRIFR